MDERTPAEVTSHSVTIRSVEEGMPWWEFHCHHAPDDPKWDGVDPETGEPNTGEGCFALSWWEGVGGELLNSPRGAEAVVPLASIPVRVVSSGEELELVPVTPKVDDDTRQRAQELVGKLRESAHDLPRLFPDGHPEEACVVTDGAAWRIERACDLLAAAYLGGETDE